MPTPRTRPRRKPRGDCIVPRPLPHDALGKFLIKRDEGEAAEIRRYVESQAHGEKVTHLEKVTTERLRGRRLDGWDVRTGKERYWVITNPTNLYTHEHFPSLDVCMSFHIGLMERVAARHKPPVPDEQQRRLAASWRRWVQAAEALDEAEEAEDFQAVGMRCRECLLELTRALVSAEMVKSGPAPKRGDFVAWTDIIADFHLAGDATKELRSFVKVNAKATWQFVNWLTHARNATPLDASIAIEATSLVLGAVGTAQQRHDHGQVVRCPACGSYKLSSEYQPDRDIDPPYILLCKACGWTETNDANSSSRRSASRS
jgi:hypothetical protein